MDDAAGPDPEAGDKAAAYDRLAYDAILALVERELAVVWHEIEAKLAEGSIPGALRGINPHHLSNGRRRLI